MQGLLSPGLVASKITVFHRYGGRPGEPHGCSPVEGAGLAVTNPCQVEVSSLTTGFTDGQEAPCCLLFLVFLLGG